MLHQKNKNLDYIENLESEVKRMRSELQMVQEKNESLLLDLKEVKEMSYQIEHSNDELRILKESSDKQIIMLHKELDTQKKSQAKYQDYIGLVAKERETNRMELQLANQKIKELQGLLSQVNQISKDDFAPGMKRRRSQ